MGDVLEQSIQTEIMSYLNTFSNIKVVKVITATVSGVSDLLVCYKGEFLAIEVKRPGITDPDPLQVEFLNDVIRAGGRAICTNNLAEVGILLTDKQYGTTLFEQKDKVKFKGVL
jgi:hypothetical protein